VGMLAELLDAWAAVVQPRQCHKVMLLVVPLAAHRDMRLDEPAVIERSRAWPSTPASPQPVAWANPA
jgi:hypothetical protein